MSAETTPITRFPKLRRFLGLTTVLCPLLTLAAVVLLGLGRWEFAVAAFGVGFVLMLLEMGIIGGAAVSPSDDTGSRGIRVGRRISELLLMFWVFTLPELDTLVHRLIHEDGLWDWRLLTAVLLMAGGSVISGLRRLAAITDRELYASVSGRAVDSGSQSSSRV